MAKHTDLVIGEDRSEGQIRRERGRAEELYLYKKPLAPLSACRGSEEESE
jgi:hypothetical protein